MPTVLLTERGRGQRPSDLPIAARRVDYHDAALPGFMVRVTPNGVRTFAVWYRVRGGGGARRLTIGRVGTISLADAREAAAKILRDARSGVDAVAERQKDRAEAQRARLVGDSLGRLTERFLEKHGPTLAPRTLAEYRRTLEADVLPELGAVAPKDVTKADVRTLIDGIRDRAPTQANRTFATLRKLFAWAVEHDLLASSPCLGLKKPAEEKPRERVFTNEEIRAIFAAVPNTELAALVPLIFYTAVRSEEARSARWSDFDFEEGLWSIPDTKEGKAHLVPLSRPCLSLLEGLSRDVEYLFPAPTREGFMDPPQKAVVLVRETSGIADFRLHDIRRTVRTRLPGLGVSPDTAERVLGHALQGMRRVYDQHDYLPETRPALEAWGRELDRIHQSKARPQSAKPQVTERPSATSARAAARMAG